MKIIQNYIYNSVVITLLVISTACADDSSSKLNTLITNSFNNKSLPADRAVFRKVLRWPDSCEERFTFPVAGITFFKQTDNQYIAQVTCTYGTYQGMSLFYNVNLGTPSSISKQIKLPVHRSNNKSITEYKTEIWGNVLSTSTVNKFKILNLYSGYGHCGSLTTYDLSGDKPSIVGLKMQSDCDTKEKVKEAERWKVIKIN